MSSKAAVSNEAIEGLGLLLSFVGVCLLVASAALVSVALAVLVAGLAVLAAGFVAIWLANARPERGGES